MSSILMGVCLTFGRGFLVILQHVTGNNYNTIIHATKIRKLYVHVTPRLLKDF